MVIEVVILSLYFPRFGVNFADMLIPGKVEDESSS